MFARKTRRLLIEQLDSRIAYAIDLVFDYSLDTSNFFNAATSNGQNARALLETAATFYETRFADTLQAIAPSGSNSWTVNFLHPATGSLTSKANLAVSANQIIVYVGGRNFSGSTLGEGGPGGWSGSGSADWLNTLKGRGQPGATLAAGLETDFSPWGGSLSFDSSGTNWNFSDQLPSSGQADFFSVALHELGHVLGFGIAPSWNNLVRSGTFTGAKSKASFGSNVPLDAAGAHWADGTSSNLLGVAAAQETALDPVIMNGARKLLTELDFAGFDDFGWNVITPTPANLVVTQSGGSTNVSESGTTDTLVLALSRLANANVSVTLTPESGLDLGKGAGIPVLVSFAPATGLATKTITVRAVNDTIIEGNHVNRISISIDSADSTFDALPNISVNVNITDNDVNSVPTNILLSSSQIAENNAVGSLVGRLSTVDANLLDTFVYSLVGTGNDNASFTLIGDQVIAQRSFDFETKSIYRIGVRTTDVLGAVFEKTFDISIQNVNESPTLLNLSKQSILSGVSVGTLVGEFTTSDPDTGDTVSIQLTTGSGSTDNHRFEIINRQLKSKEVFNKSVQSTMQIRVAAKDSAGSSLEKNFTIVVLDESDFPNEDINLDGTTGPSDVIAVINEINRLGSGPLRPGQDRRLDTNRDGILSPIDVARVINFINSRNAVLVFSDKENTVVDEASPFSGAIADTAAVDSVFQSFDASFLDLTLKKKSQILFSDPYVPEPIEPT